MIYENVVKDLIRMIEEESAIASEFIASGNIIVATTRLDDVVDSLALLEFCMYVEDMYNIPDVDERVIKKQSTVGGVAAYLIETYPEYLN